MMGGGNCDEPMHYNPVLNYGHTVPRHWAGYTEMRGKSWHLCCQQRDRAMGLNPSVTGRKFAELGTSGPILNWGIAGGLHAALAGAIMQVP